MLSSPLLRRLLLIGSGYCVAFAMILELVGHSLTASDVETSTLRMRLIVTAVMLLAVGLSLVIYFVYRRIAPLEELARSIVLLANDRHPDHVMAEHDDEIGRAARACNESAQTIEVRISELRREQQRVIRDNEQLGTVLEAMVEGVIAVDREERILFANSAAVRLLDLKSFNVVGRRIWEAIRLPQIDDLIRSTIEDEEQRRVEFIVPWTYSTAAVVASPLPGSPCPGAVVVLHDITDLRRLENLRRDFVSNVSHELKTPLAAISAYADTLLNGAMDDSTVSLRFLRRISEQSDRLNSLILDLLELSRIESGERIFRLDPVDVNEVLRSSIDSHLAIADAKQLTLAVSFAETPLFGQADAEGLRTIVDNLISNAINYSRPSGRVSVRSRLDDPWIVFEVEDTGVGIAKEHQLRIFERFYRVDKARSREVGGTGLGLSIVKHLCQLFGGHVKVKSQLGLGSTFTVQLAASEQESATEDAILHATESRNLD